jgi:hypothetical protein
MPLVLVPDIPPRATAGPDSLAVGYGTEVENDQDGIMRVAGQPEGPLPSAGGY